MSDRGFRYGDLITWDVTDSKWDDPVQKGVFLEWAPGGFIYAWDGWTSWQRIDKVEYIIRLERAEDRNEQDEQA